MKRKLVGICVCMLVIATAVPAVGTLKTIHENNLQPQRRGVEWNLTYDRGEFDEFRHVTQTMPDKGYICCGLTEETNNYYVLLVKLDTDGNEEWHVVNYDLNGTVVNQFNMELRAFQILQTKDGGFLIIGSSVISVEVQGENYWIQTGYLWKINATGTTEWLHRYYNIEEQAVDVPYYCVETSDGYVVTGFRAYYELTGVIIDITGYLMKTDITGNPEWEKTYDAGGEDYLTSVCSTSDGGYLATGWVDTPTFQNGALWMVKTTSTGIKEWERFFDGPAMEYTYGKGCFQTSDGGYILAGNTASYGAGLVDVWVIKTNSSGNEIWNKTYGYNRNDYTWSMAQTSDGDYVLGICKDIYYTGGNRSDIWIVQITKDGNTEWSYLIKEAGNQIITCIEQTDDGGFVVSGRTDEYGTPTADGLVVKVGPFPHLDLEITGGLGVKASTTNSGLGDAVAVPWEITVTGGIFGLINVTKNGTIDILATETQTVTTGLFLGLGPISITATVAIKEKTATAFVLGPFVLGVK